jgi:hypothetical protein
MRFATLVLMVLCVAALAMPGEVYADDAEVTAAAAAEEADAGPIAMPATAPEPTPPASAPAAADSSIWSTLGFRVSEVVANAVGAMIALALGLLARWLTSKTSNERVRALIAQANDAAQTAVAAVQQTTVDALKAAGDGKLTKFEAKEVAAAALASAKLILGTKGLATLQSALALGQTELEAWLTARVEASVQAQRKAST